MPASRWGNGRCKSPLKCAVSIKKENRIFSNIYIIYIIYIYIYVFLFIFICNIYHLYLKGSVTIVLFILVR